MTHEETAALMHEEIERALHGEYPCVALIVVDANGSSSMASWHSGGLSIYALLGAIEAHKQDLVENSSQPRDGCSSYQS